MEERCSRRQFLRTAAIGTVSVALTRRLSWAEDSTEKPNLVFIFADQWRAQSTGYAGNKDVKTPHLDRLAKESVNFSNAVSGCPVCSPYRASLLTGQYWLTHGIFYNDKPLNPDAVTIGKVYRAAGYETGYSRASTSGGSANVPIIIIARLTMPRRLSSGTGTVTTPSLKPARLSSTFVGMLTSHPSSCSCHGVRRTLRIRRLRKNTAKCLIRPESALVPTSPSH